MKFKIILKTKNEYNLIDLWIQYYSKLVGKENILIFDNNSTDHRIFDIYNHHSIQVQNIPKNPDSIHLYWWNKNFYEEIFASSDWFAVLDTDEFLCSYKDGVFSVEGVLDILKNSSNNKILGSIWLSHMHSGKSIEYFKVNTDKHNIYAGKAIIGTSYPLLRDIIYGHNASCINQNGDIDAELSSGLVLLHLDRIDPESRIQNCIDMVLQSIRGQSTEEQEIFSALQQLKNNGNLDDKTFLYKDYNHIQMNGIHKLREVQLYYRDKENYLRTFYSTQDHYIRTNIIRNYLYNEPYIQEIVPSNSDFLYLNAS